MDLNKKIVLYTCGMFAACALLAASQHYLGDSEDASREQTNWPDGSVTVVVPYGAGGDTDTYCRQMCNLLSKDLGANFVVVNTTGGAGVIASTSVLGARPNGNTILFHHTGVMLTQEAVGTNQFSFLDDFEVVGTIARDDTYALIVKSDSQWHNLEELIAWAKANPGKLRYSITYYGATHAVAEMMERSMGISMDNIDVGSSTSSRLTAFLAGQCDVLVVNFMNIADYVEKGDFTVLGICAESRPAGLEKFPTLKEQGYNVVLSKIYELRMPKGVHPSTVAKLSSALAKVAESEDYKKPLRRYYASPFYRDAKRTIEEDRKEVAMLRQFFIPDADKK